MHSTTFRSRTNPVSCFSCQSLTLQTVELQVQTQKQNKKRVVYSRIETHEWRHSDTWLWATANDDTSLHKFRANLVPCVLFKLFQPLQATLQPTCTPAPWGKDLYLLPLLFAVGAVPANLLPLGFPCMFLGGWGGPREEPHYHPVWLLAWTPILCCFLVFGFYLSKSGFQICFLNEPVYASYHCRWCWSSHCGPRPLHVCTQPLPLWLRSLHQQHLGVRRLCWLPRRQRRVWLSDRYWFSLLIGSSFLAENIIVYILQLLAKLPEIIHITFFLHDSEFKVTLFCHVPIPSTHPQTENTQNCLKPGLFAYLSYCYLNNEHPRLEMCVHAVYNRK